MLTEQECIALTPNGWAFGGKDEGYYIYVTTIPETRKMISSDTYQITPQTYKEMLLLEEDMTERNIAFMVEHGLTRVKK